MNQMAVMEQKRINVPKSRASVDDDESVRPHHLPGRSGSPEVIQRATLPCLTLAPGSSKLDPGFLNGARRSWF